MKKIITILLILLNIALIIYKNNDPFQVFGFIIGWGIAIFIIQKIAKFILIKKNLFKENQDLVALDIALIAYFIVFFIFSTI